MLVAQDERSNDRRQIATFPPAGECRQKGFAMSIIKFGIVISSAGRRAEALAGNTGSAKREIVANLADLTQHQRDVIVPLSWINYQDNLVLDMQDTASKITRWILSESPSYISGRESGVTPEAWIEKHIVQFDAMPDADQIIAEIERILVANAQVQAQAEAKARPYAEAFAAKQQAQAESDARHAQEYARMRPLLDALVAAGDYEAVNVASTFPGSVGRPEWYDWLYHPSRQESLLSLQSEGFAAIRKARAEAEKARADAEKARWIDMHGSEYLRRACIEHGYNCQRRYVLERAALESPSYVVDWHNGAEWKSRSCPSEAALDELELAESLDLGSVEVEVVWLTENAQPERSEDECPEEFEPCEAVVIRGYLGKYDLVKIVL